MSLSMNTSRLLLPQCAWSRSCWAILAVVAGVSLLLAFAAGAAIAATSDSTLRMLGYSAMEREALQTGNRSLAGMSLEMRLRLAGFDRAAAAQQVLRYEHARNTPVAPRLEWLGRLPAAARFYWPLLESYSRQQGLDPALVLAVVKVESDFNPRARSPAGATGLMQLMPLTARELGVADPWHAAQNLAGGTRHLARCLKRFGNKVQALAAYNAGEGRVPVGGGIPPIAETRAYVERVLRFERIFGKALAGSGA